MVDKKLSMMGLKNSQSEKTLLPQLKTTLSLL
jgi:hypothetical protein